MKRYWNHRVLAFTHDDEVTFEVCEVHYDKDGNPESWGQGLVVGDSKTDLMWSLKAFLDCLDKPVLDANNWPSEYAGEFATLMRKKK